MRPCALITIDIYRLAEKEQLEQYAKALGDPPINFRWARYRGELKKFITVESEVADIILIDTMGRSPKEAIGLGEMRDTLDACGNKLESYLVVQAMARAQDIKEIIRQFEPFAYKAVIVSKLDEINAPGNVISALAEKGKSVAYFTTGQESTPGKMEKATVMRLLLMLSGFEMDRERLEAAFPSPVISAQ
jgi:flagellar biosynthesis protein FlhF